jgi:glycosyltransferase involved in cell wall biosynthesis
VVEPFGLVILEAAMSGLPVIVSDRAYLAADAERLGFGVVCDPTAPRQLAELMASLAVSDAQAESMSCSGFARSGELALSASAWSERFINQFRTMVMPRAMT